MSKTKAQLAKLLSATNEQLFDRYINVTLSQNKPGTAAPEKPKSKVSGNTIISPTLEEIQKYNSDLTAHENVLKIKTPKAGIKPHISVAATLIGQSYVHDITVTIYNISEQIDTMEFNWAEVEVGYMNSGVHVTFVGQIISCYMAKPNPNGELVVTIATANMVDLYARGDFEVAYDKDTVTTKELLQTALNAAATKYPKLEGVINNDEIYQSIPEEWLAEKFMVRKATRHYRSVMELLTWLNSLFASYSYQTGFATGAGLAPIVDDKEKAKTVKLPPLKLGFDAQGNLQITGTYAFGAPAATKALSCVGNAFLNGEEATVQAPFNPGILPGDVIFVDIKYFKTRVNMEGVPRELNKSLGNLWKVIDNKFVFDTHRANVMTLRLNNLNNLITAGQG